MFETSAAFALFDQFRVPHRQVDEADRLGLEWVRSGSASLLWPGERLLQKTRPEPYIVGSVPVFARLLPEGAIGQLVHGLPGSWRSHQPVRDSGGRVVGAIWRSDDGSAVLPFDPSQALTNFWTELYVEVGPRGWATRIASVVREAYYRARPLLPRDVQLRLRRTFSRVQRRSRFPRWPVETAVDDLFRLLFRLVAEVAGEPVPYLSAWPGDSSWALVLTHDVERRVGYDGVDLLRDIELEEGYRSSWNFVPCNGYVVERALLEQLRAQGFEIGVHGLFHDGRDLMPRTLPRRLPAIRAYAEHWHAVGFRSPATIRSPRLIPLLGFDYDSSYADTAPFEPQAGGCCTWLPYLLGGTVELPITLEQDHTLFDLLGHRDETLWIEKARIIRERGGMALMITHPDYAGNPDLRTAYQGFLREFANDATAWKALPRDVAAWWRRRGDSRIEREGDEWRVVGPAVDEARIEFFAAEPARG